MIEVSTGGPGTAAIPAASIVYWSFVSVPMSFRTVPASVSVLAFAAAAAPASPLALLAYPED